MKNIKRISIVLLICTFLAAVCVVPASAIVMSDSYFEYEVNFIKKEATIVKCLTDEADIVVPSHYMDYSITAIDNYAFENNQKLVSIALPGNVKSVGSYAFRNCKALRFITIPESVTKLGEGFCAGCLSLEKAYVNAAVNKLSAFSFNGCESLDYVRLNTGISAIGQSVFSGCSSLQSIKLPENLALIDRAAFFQSGLKSFEFNESVTSVYDYTFAGCQNLTQVNIPVTVSYIDPSAFNNDPNLTLGVWYGSYGYEYAKTRNSPYILLDGALLGDSNGDGIVNINDVTTIQRYLAEMDTLEGIFLHAADVNQDGKVDIEDATAIQMYLAEYEMVYPISEIMTQ